jgi:hypothetical protein
MGAHRSNFTGHYVKVHRSKYKGVYESPQIRMTRHSANAHRSNFKINFGSPGPIFMRYLGKLLDPK